MVSHTHLQHGSPTYQVADHVDHLHLVCRGCGSVTEADLQLGRPLADTVLDRHGFSTDLRPSRSARPLCRLPISSRRTGKFERPLSATGFMTDVTLSLTSPLLDAPARCRPRAPTPASPGTTVTRCASSAGSGRPRRRPLAPRRDPGHRPRPALLAALADHPAADRAPAAPRETLILSPHGHVETRCTWWTTARPRWITVEPGTAAAVVDWLAADAVHAPGRGRRRDGAWAVVGVAATGRGGAAPSEPGGSPAWRTHGPTPGPGSASTPPSARRGAPGRGDPGARCWCPRHLRRALARSTGRNLGGRGPPGGRLAASARASRPITAPSRTRPTGCAPPSTCRRAATAGRRRWPGCTTGPAAARLVMLHLDGSEHTLPAHGDAVSLGERQVGRVTTGPRHHELGPIALAMIKRSTPGGRRRWRSRRRGRRPRGPGGRRRA